MQRGSDGQIYSIHAPGLSALVAPAFALAGYPGGRDDRGAPHGGRDGPGLAGGVPGVGLGAAAWFAWLAVTTAAPIVLHGFTIYPDPVGAAAVMAGVLALVWLDLSPRAALGPGRWLSVGAALALLPWLHTRFALLAGVLGAVLALRLIRRPGGGRALASMLLVPTIAAVGWFSYFWLIYGSPNPAAPYGRRPGSERWPSSRAGSPACSPTSSSAWP